MRSGMRYVSAAALMVAVVTMSVAQQPGGGRPGGGGGPLGLVANKAVQEDIKVTDEQKTKLETLAKDLGKKIGETMREKLKDVPREEMREKMAPIMAELNKEAYTAIGEVLKPEQVARIKQIALQQQGLRAFENPDVAKVLKLDDDQKAKIKGIAEESSKAGREAFEGLFTPGQRPDREKMEAAQKKSAEVRKEAMEKTIKTLNDDQQVIWKKLTGETFDVSKLGFGGFGGGFGGQGGGNRPPRNNDNNK